jgi:hypothetical protein
LAFQTLNSLRIGECRQSHAGFIRNRVHFDFTARDNAGMATNFEFYEPLSDRRAANVAVRKRSDKVSNRGVWLTLFAAFGADAPPGLARRWLIERIKAEADKG